MSIERTDILAAPLMHGLLAAIYRPGPLAIQAVTKCLVWLLALWPVSSFAQGAVLQLTPGATVSTVAGTGKQGYSGDGKGAQLAALASPAAVAYSTTGDLYIADTRNHVVRRITSDGHITTIVGNGIEGFSGDGGSALAASLDSPQGIAIATDGTLFIADTHNQRIRRVSVSGIISTIAGTGVPGFSGDTANATSAQLRSPGAIALGLAGEIYVADTGNHRVRRIALDGIITTVAGNGVETATGDSGKATQAGLDSPSGIAIRADGALLIADRLNSRIRIVTADGMISSLSTGNNALRHASSVGTAPDGTVYVADTGHHQILEVDPNGSGLLYGPSDASSPAVNVVSVAPDSLQGVAVADRSNSQILHIALPQLIFADTILGFDSPALTLDLQNAGDTLLTVSTVSVPAGFATSASTCGAAPFILEPAKHCTVSLVFRPTSEGTSHGIVSVDLANALSQRAVLSGKGLPPNSTYSLNLLLRSATPLSYAGVPLTLTSTVVAGATAAPTGTITFLDGGKEIGAVPLASNNIAVLTTSALTLGQHTLTARFSGDVRYAASTSTPLQQSIVPAPDFTIASTAGSVSMSVGSTGVLGFSLQPVNGVLGHLVAIKVDGLPSGTVANITPVPLQLTSDPVTVNISIKLPGSLALLQAISPVMACGLIAPLFYRRNKGLLLGLAGFVVLALVGCGGGFLNKNSTATTTTSRSYPIVVTASTLGVTGDVLVHTATVTLVVNE